MDNKFMEATKRKLRYPLRGMISTEDLWDLNVEQLDQIYRELAAQRREISGESLLATGTEEDNTLQLQLCIVREVFDQKQAAAVEARNASAKKAERQKIMAALAAKEDEELMGKSADELRAMLHD